MHPLIKTRDFVDDDEVHHLVAAFETGGITPSEFHHGAHIALALAYLSESSLTEATTRMRSSLRSFTRSHGLDVYHETITTFWMRLLDHLASTHYANVALFRRINLIFARWGNAGPVEAHYSRELVSSRRAREEWVPPDRLPLPF